MNNAIRPRPGLKIDYEKVMKTWDRMQRKFGYIPASEKPKPPDALIDVNEAAELLGVAVSTIYGWVSQAPYQGKAGIPHHKPSASVLRFDRGELLAWAKRRNVPSMKKGA